MSGIDGGLRAGWRYEPSALEMGPAEAAGGSTIEAAPQGDAAAAPTPGSSGGGAGRLSIMADLAARASAALPADALAVDPAKVDKAVADLYRAMKGLGTNEELVYKTLEGASPDERRAIEQSFGERHGKVWPSLRHALADEFSGKEKIRAFDALDAGRPEVLRQENLRDVGSSGGPGHAVRHLLTWFTFGVGGKSDAEDGLPRLTGDQIRQDMLPHLKPGDTILSGNNGGLSHAMVYIGDGKMIHAMATEKTMRGNAGRLWDTVTAPIDIAREKLGTKERMQGVMVEDVADFFDRFERDTYVIMREPNLDEGKTAKGLDRIKDLVGKPYDWDFAPGNEAYYCTEIVGEFYRAALGDESPRIGARPQSVPLVLDRAGIMDPLDVFESADLKPVLYNQAALGQFKDRLAPEG